MKPVLIPSPGVQHSESEFSPTDWKVEYVFLVASFVKTLGRNGTDIAEWRASGPPLHSSGDHIPSPSARSLKLVEKLLHESGGFGARIPVIVPRPTDKSRHELEPVGDNDNEKDDRKQTAPQPIRQAGEAANVVSPASEKNARQPVRKTG
jgi:hypothetical protein